MKFLMTIWGKKTGWEYISCWIPSEILTLAEEIDHAICLTTLYNELTYNGDGEKGVPIKCFVGQ